LRRPLPDRGAGGYLAAFHSAEAYIYEQAGRTVKTLRGLRTTFSRLTRNEPRIAPEYLTFLARAYELKSIADYSVGPAARPITADAAARAIETAERFIDTITQLLPPSLAASRSSAAQPQLLAHFHKLRFRNTRSGTARSCPTGATRPTPNPKHGGSVACLGNVGKGAIRRPGFRRSKKRENIHAGDERGRVQRL
jgi:uncharacterized protein (UPF0332 family)